MTVPALALAHYQQQKALAAKTSVAARRLWSQMTPADFDGSWQTVGPRARALLTLAQARAATNGAAYVARVVAAQGVTDAPVANVDPAKLAGVASSGGNVDALLYAPVIAAKQQVAQGASALQALQQARALLEGIVLTQVADAGRVATGTAIAARPNVPGFVRMLTRPSCSRCVVLAGKTFHWNRGFPRHPRCDCVHIPVAEDTFNSLTTDPMGYFQSLSQSDQDRTFGIAGAQAIRHGADIGQVVNARKGMYTASERGRTLSATHQGNRRPSSRSGARVDRLRLMPEQIFKDAASRDDAIRLLRLHGYLR